MFAYGATGSGKTHTMLGSDEQPGVVYHTMIDLYHRIAQMEDEKTCSVAVSYLEVCQSAYYLKSTLLQSGYDKHTLLILLDYSQGQNIHY